MGGWGPSGVCEWNRTQLPPLGRDGSVPQVEDGTVYSVHSESVSASWGGSALCSLLLLSSPLSLALCHGAGSTDGLGWVCLLWFSLAVEAVEKKPQRCLLTAFLSPSTPLCLQVEVTESSNQDALSGSSDLLELLLQEDSRSGTGSAASGSLGSGLGSGSGSGSHEGGSTSASITRECPSSRTSQSRTEMGRWEAKPQFDLIC